MNEFRLSDSENSLDYDVYTRCEEIQNELNQLMELLDNQYGKIPLKDLSGIYNLLNGVDDDVLFIIKVLKELKERM